MWIDGDVATKFRSHFFVVAPSSSSYSIFTFLALYGDSWRWPPSFHVLTLFIHVLFITYNTHCWVLCFLHIWKLRQFRFSIGTLLSSRFHLLFMVSSFALLLFYIFCTILHFLHHFLVIRMIVFRLGLNICSKSMDNQFYMLIPCRE